MPGKLASYRVGRGPRLCTVLYGGCTASLSLSFPPSPFLPETPMGSGLLHESSFICGGDGRRKYVDVRMGFARLLVIVFLLIGVSYKSLTLNK